MTLRMHPRYAALIGKARSGHRNNRSATGITDLDVELARLHCYAFRTQTIGAFHATRQALFDRPESDSAAMRHRLRATETLSDLADMAMDPVPADFRALLSTLFRYHSGIERVLESLAQDAIESRDGEIERIAGRFRKPVEEVLNSNGIHLTQDTAAPPQASFVVPNLGIVIVPLVYGDHHSWNLAYLAGQARDVPVHRHEAGVEIHLGDNPTHGRTILGDCTADVSEGYAMPIPPRTDHGWVNTSDETHHVPFVFGSLTFGGWGVFLDVEPVSRPADERRAVKRSEAAFRDMVYLERELDAAAARAEPGRSVLIPLEVTDRPGTGGLELGVTRVTRTESSYPAAGYRICSVSRGQGLLSLGGAERAVRPHDHFGIPAGIPVTLRQTGSDPLVLLDATIDTVHAQAALESGR